MNYSLTISSVRVDLGNELFVYTDEESLGKEMFMGGSVKSLAFQLKSFIGDRKGQYVESDENERKIVIDTSDLTIRLILEKSEGEITDEEFNELTDSLENR